MRGSTDMQQETRYDARFFIEIRADLADLLARRAGVERRSLKEQAAWLLEQKLMEDRDQHVAMAT